MNTVMDKVTAVMRVARRLTWLAGEIGRAASRTGVSPVQQTGFSNGGAGGTPALRWRALRLHKLCRRLLPIFGAKFRVSGSVPTRGLLVANHLSYLDIIVLASLTPCVFVAKSEVATWPVFGWFARRAGTIFVNRRSRRDVERANSEIRAALDAGALVVLFPEGTSSGGETVLPFKSSLLEPVVGRRVPIHVGALAYQLDDGDARHEACYWGGHTLVPHLLRLLSKRRVRVALACSEVGNTWRDRKKLAAQLHAEVTALHEQLRAASNGGALPAFLSPQGGEGLRVRGDAIRTRSHKSRCLDLPTPHPGPLPVKGRGGKADGVRPSFVTALSKHVPASS
jgi:1-acyl-sn-glycerol-3-phosphate acyltransferase